MVEPDVLSWHEVQRDFQRRLDQIHAALHTAKDAEMLQLQGKAQLLSELMNLPQTLILQREKVK